MLPRSPKIRILALASLCLLVTALLASDLPDTHTPENFLFDRQSRVVGEYIDTVLKRGDAGTLVAPVAQIHANLQGGGYSSAELEVMEVNLLTLIATAEGLVRGQEYADKIDEVYEAAAAAASLEAWQEDVAELELDSTEATTESYTPPEHDKIYNEKKKDLLEEAYDMLETLRARRS